MAEGINKKQDGQRKRNSNYYKLQAARTEKNKTKKVVRHFKSNPFDGEADLYLSAKGYKTDTIPRTRKGRKLEARA